MNYIYTILYDLYIIHIDYIAIYSLFLTGKRDQLVIISLDNSF